MLANPDFIDFDLPCRGPNADDWFIEPRIILTPEEVDELRHEAIDTAHYEHLAAEKIEDMKRRRRRAISTCYNDCPMQARLLCLDEGLKPENVSHGIWGAYPENERRAMVAAIRARKKGTMSRRVAARLMIASEERKAALKSE